MFPWLLRALLACWLLTLAAPAHALSDRMSGFSIDLGAGTGAAGAPFRFGAGWQASLCWWRGSYDDVYSLGRYTGAAVTLRQDYTADGLRTAPLAELRRGMDLIVAGFQGHVAAGPLFAASEVGGTARLGVTGKFRRHAFWGITLRVEAGVDYVGGQVSPQFGTLLGGSFARPFRKVDLHR